tara:strand:- start:259 stop:516 length:258 start_codon:yes stop_codon:yes gene_type:complete
MEYQAKINIMPLKSLLDPQGKAVSQSMKNINLPEITNVRIGKHITLKVTAKSLDEAKDITEKACEKLLANPIMEEYKIDVKELSS